MTFSNPYTWADTAGVSSDTFNTGVAMGTSPTGGGFSKTIGDIATGIGGIGRIAGAGRDIYNVISGKGGGPLGGLFDPAVMEGTTSKLDERSTKTLEQIRDIFENIAGLTGVATSDAVQDYYNRFSDYMDTAYSQAREDLAVQPDLTKQYTDLASRIADIRESDLNLLNSPQYMAIAKSPQTYMSSVDTEAIKSVMDLGPKYKETYSYEDPESQSLIRGRASAIEDYANLFANNPSIKQTMMGYSV